MKLQKLLIATALMASVSGFAAPVFTPPEIVLTENSATSLTATIDGSSLSVFEISPDNWFVYGFGSGLINGSAQWSDPDDAGKVNTVGSSLDSTLGLGLLVHADVAPGGGPQFANDTKDTTDFSYLGATFLPVNVTYNDLGGTSTVPDEATTISLLGAAAGGLFCFGRRTRK